MAETRSKGQPGAEHLVDLGVVNRVLSLFSDERELATFARGYTDGKEGADYAAQGRKPNSLVVDSPLRDITAMPAWFSLESRAVLNGESHSLIRSLGAVVGAFAERAGIDLDEQLAARAAQLQLDD